MANERIYVVRGRMDGAQVPSIFTGDIEMAQDEYLALVNINVEHAHIEDANTGEVYAYYDCARTEWGTEISRGVSREFTEILVGLRV